MIAYCGLDCESCQTYIATRNDDNDYRAKIVEECLKEGNTRIKLEDVNCDGCTKMEGRYIGYCAECGVHQCASARDVENCAHCENYPCETLETFLKTAPRAKANLEEIRKTL